LDKTKLKDMKKVFLLAFTLIIGFNFNANSQSYHRLSNGQPYDIFYIIKPAYFKAYGDDFTKNYVSGAGFNLGLEYQFQEIKLGLGVEMGYSFIQGNSYKIKYLPRKYVKNLSQVPLTIYANYYLHNQESYFSFFDRLKPYVGIGVGAIWGNYDYSLSNEDNKDYDSFGYYLREYEGQGGIRVGILPRAGLLFATDNYSFGFEIGFQQYFQSDRLEKQQQITYGFTYMYIID